MSFNRWWNRKGNSFESDSEKTSDDPLNKLREEQKRHEEAMKKLQRDHDDEMKRLNSGPWRYFTSERSWLGGFFGPSKRESEASSSAPKKSDCYRCRDDGPGNCFIIWNESKGQANGAEGFAQAFLSLGFTVQLKKNLSEQETQKLLKKISTERSECTSMIIVFASKGTPEYIRTADGRKMKLRDIVDSFRPRRAPEVTHVPKLFLFQCEAESRAHNMWNYEDPPFEPKYDDAFVLCSTHRKFLPTLTKHLAKDFRQEFQVVMSKVGDELIRDSTAQDAIGMISTLQKELFFNKG